MQPETTNKPSVLLVEDSEDDAFFFQRTLQKSKHTCAFRRAANGAEAVEFLQQSVSDSRQLPEVMFLDLKMPVLNGFEVLDWLKNQPFASKIRVIVLSGSEHQNDKDRAAELGAADYLVKPVRIGDLDRFLQDVCPADTERGANT